MSRFVKAVVFPILLFSVALLSVLSGPVYAAQQEQDGFENEATVIHKTYGDEDFTIRPAVQGLTVFSSKDESIATVGSDNGMVHILKAGSVTITAEALDEGGNVSDRQTFLIQIGRAPVIVSGIDSKGKTYDGNTDAELYCDGAEFDGLLDGDSLSVTAKGTFSDRNAGSQKRVYISDMILEGDDADNYELAPEGQQEYVDDGVILQKTVNITGLAAEDKIYDGTDEVVLIGTGVVEGAIDGDDVRVKMGTARFGTSDATMNCSVIFHRFNIEGKDRNNYELSDQPHGVYANIYPRSIESAAVFLSQDRFIYDGKEKYVNVDRVELTEDLLLDPEKDYEVSGDGFGKDKGRYALTVTGKNNYNGTLTAEWLISDKFMGASAADQRIIFDNKPHSITVGVENLKDGYEIRYGTHYGVYDLTKSPAITDAGVLTVYYRVSAEGYLYESGKATVRIQPRPVTVKADDKEKLVRMTDPPLTATVTGLVRSASQNSVDYILSRVAGEEPGEYDIIPSGQAVQGNYTIVCEKGRFTINERKKEEASGSEKKDEEVRDAVSVNTKVEDGKEIRVISFNSDYAVKQTVDASAYLGTHKKYLVLPKGAARIDKKKKLITLKKSGMITITAYDKEDGKWMPKEEVNLRAHQTLVKQKKIKTVAMGQSIDGAANIDDGVLMPDRWESSNPPVATVDEKTGLICPITAGRTNITAYYGSGKNAMKVKFVIKVLY